MSLSRRTPIEELRRIDRSMTPGSLDGRIGEARLIVGSGSTGPEIDLGGTDLILDDRLELVYFWQDRFICTRSGSQTLTLSYLPMEKSEHLYWGTVYQRGTVWSRPEGGKVVTIEDPDGHLQVGDILTFEYAYIPGAVPAETNYPIILPATGVMTIPDMGLITISGEWPVFYDGSDETYVEQDLSDFPHYYVALPPLESYKEGDLISLHVRQSATGGGSSVLNVFLRTDSGSTLSLGGFTDGDDYTDPWELVAGDGVVRDQFAPLVVNSSSFTLEDAVAALKAGAQLYIDSFHGDWISSPHAGRIHEAWVQIDSP